VDNSVPEVDTYSAIWAKIESVTDQCDGVTRVIESFHGPRGAVGGPTVRQTYM